MGLILATTSGKGGVGKSGVAACLGLTFAREGDRVLLVDMDEGLGSLDLILGLESSAVSDLSDALVSKDILDVAYATNTPNLSLIPAPKVLGAIDGELFKTFVKRADKIFDVIVFDFPAGLDFSLYSLMPAKTQFLCVATPDPVCVRSSSAVGHRLAEMGLNSRLIINRFDYKEHKSRRYKSIDGIIDASSIRLLGIVPESEEINKLSVKHSLKSHGKTAKAFLRIAERLRYKNIPLKNLKKI